MGASIEYLRELHYKTLRSILWTGKPDVECKYEMKTEDK